MNTSKIILFLGFIIYNSVLFSINYKQNDTYFNHLYTVNKQWEFYKDACPKGKTSFKTDEDRIELHLKLVCNYLIKNTSNHLSKQQVKERYRLILSLLDYANKKEFPINLYHKNRQPYFIDHRGVHCAVGYLMQQSGNEKLAQQIKQEHNFDYIKDIKTPGVAEWATQYGFTINELKWIQPGYPTNY
jgi:hypothetical protein